MNVDAFPPVRNKATSGSGCGFTCHEEMVLQTDWVRAGWLSSPGHTAGLGQPMSSTFPPSQQPQHTEPPSKLMGSGLFPEALLFQHYTGLETSKLSSFGGTEAFSCSSHPSVTIFTLGIGGSGVTSLQSGEVQLLLHSESPWCCFHTPDMS